MDSDSEIAKLRKALAEVKSQISEEQHRRKKAESRVSEEQRLRGEAESRALDQQRRREKEQRLREEEQHLHEEEQHRHEEAEKVARASQPQTLQSYLEACTLQSYLEACHSLSLSIEVITDRSLTTQSDATNPVGQIYPRRIVPWDDFPAKQEAIWNQLSEPSFISQHAFPSQHQLEYVRSLSRPICSEHGLQYFERDTVENAVQKLIDAVYENPLLRDSLGLRGTVMFESHTNFGIIDNNLSEDLERMSLTSDSAGDLALAPTVAIRKARRIAKGTGKGNRANQFCIYRTSDGANIPVTAIEYKAPHKLSQDEVVTGLASEIYPERDVINKDGEGFAFASKALATAVVTQLFSDMIGKGVQYGYVCTGQAFVFLYIPDDPTMVFYYVCVPNLDVLNDDENGLHRTAVAQVFAFILQALRTAPPPLSWNDAALMLDTWAVEYDDVLSRIPETVRKGKERCASLYKPQRWHKFKRSPIKTRSRCKQPDINSDLRDEDSGDEATHPSPALDWLTRFSKKAATSSSAFSERQGQRNEGGRQQGKAAQGRIHDRPYCTHKCLLGLSHGEPIDKNCPNAGSHGEKHIDRLDFLDLLRAQLAVDRGRDADSTPLYLSGSVGALFKVRLSVHGYTLVAKGVERAHRVRLQHERKVYDQLRPIQGKYVPVCLGLIDPVLPFYYEGGVFEHLILLSWAGRPLSQCINQLDKKFTVDLIAKAFAEIHRLRICHRDAEARNILYDKGLMIVDFERAEICSRRPLSSIGPDGQNRKWERGMLQKQGNDIFARELQSVVESVSSCFGSVKVITMPAAG